MSREFRRGGACEQSGSSAKSCRPRFRYRAKVGAAALIEMVADQDLGQAYLRRASRPDRSGRRRPHIARIARFTGNRDRSLGRHPSGGHSVVPFRSRPGRASSESGQSFARALKTQRLTYDRFSRKDELFGFHRSRLLAGQGRAVPARFCVSGATNLLNSVSRGATARFHTIHSIRLPKY